MPAVSHVRAEFCLPPSQSVVPGVRRESDARTRCLREGAAARCRVRSHGREDRRGFQRSGEHPDRNAAGVSGLGPSYRRLRAVPDVRAMCRRERSGYMQADGGQDLQPGIPRGQRCCPHQTCMRDRPSMGVRFPEDRVHIGGGGGIFREGRSSFSPGGVYWKWVRQANGR